MERSSKKRLSQPRSRVHGLATHLTSELERRCKSNPRYSLRAFARTLSMEPSYLSKVLRGERVPTAAVILRAGERIGADPIQVRDWIESTSDQATQELQRRRESMDATYVALTEDQLSSISEWYHYAILELFEIEAFVCTASATAAALGITVDAASAAIERMIRLGMIVRDENGRIRTSGNSYSTVASLSDTAQALRKFQGQILSMAQHALENVPFEERSQSSMTLSVDSERLDAAHELIKDFRRKFSHLMKASKKKNRVYHLNVSFYPVTPKLGVTSK